MFWWVTSRALGGGVSYQSKGLGFGCPTGKGVQFGSASPNFRSSPNFMLVWVITDSAAWLVLAARSYVPSSCCEPERAV
jgi:hypothetical protein